MTRRRRDMGIRLTPKWLPLIVERIRDVVLASAAAHRGQGLDDTALELERHARGLMGAQLWWVTGDMTTLAVDTAEDTVGFDGRTDVPEQPLSGFIVWDGGLPIRVEDARIPDPEGVRITAAYWRATDRGVMFETYSGDPRLERFDGGVRTPLHRVDGARMTAERRRFLSRVVVATLALASQPAIGAVRDGSWSGDDRPRAVGRAMEGRPSPDVKYVYLRETRPEDDDGGGASGRMYSCRWIVRGFYRQQPYGPDRSLRRRQWIPPHVAGPSDKPLRVKSTVYIWRR